MDSGHNRDARALEIKNAIGEGLVVVHDVEVVGMLENQSLARSPKVQGSANPPVSLLIHSRRPSGSRNSDSDTAWTLGHTNRGLAA